MKMTEAKVGVVMDKHIHFVDCQQFQMKNPTYFSIVRDPIDRFVSR